MTGWQVLVTKANKCPGSFGPKHSPTYFLGTTQRRSVGRDNDSPALHLNPTLDACILRLDLLFAVESTD